MANAREMRFWDGVAWLCLHMPTMSKKKRSLSDFHPIRKQKAKVNLQRVEKQMDEFSNTLPKTLTEEEIKARWLKHKESGR